MGPWDAELDRIVTRRFESPTDGTWYHYTSEEGALGIIQSQKFWCTRCGDARGDPTDLAVAGDVIAEEAKRLLTPSSPPYWQASCSNFLARFGRESLRQVTEVYITCFSAAPDIPEQWTRYADIGRGACIGFRTHVALPDNTPLISTFVRVEYDIEQTRNRVRGAFEDLRREQMRLVRARARSSLVSYYVKVVEGAMLRVAAFAQMQAKRSEFRAEQERRIVLMSKDMRHPHPPVGPPDKRRHERDILPGKLADIASIHVGRNAPSDTEQRFEALLLAKGYPPGSVPMVRAK